MGRAGGGDGGCGEGQKPVISTFRGNESVHTSISLISEINEWAINHVSFWDEFVVLAYEYELSESDIHVLLYTINFAQLYPIDDGIPNMLPPELRE